MRNKKAILLVVLGSALLLFSCKVIKDIKQSRQTIEDQFVLIPAGTIDILDRPQDSEVFKYELNFHRDPVVKADSFFMSKFEVSNSEYREFLWVIARQKDTAAPYHQFSRSGDTAYYNKMKLDSTVWVRPRNFRKEDMYSIYLPAYSEYYFIHFYYNDYPVVGISHEQAVAYCEFRTEMYNNYSKRKYKKVLFRLPTKMEWEFAASGGKPQQKFPWAGDKMVDTKGNAKANFKVIDQSNIAISTYPYNYFGKIEDREITVCRANYNPQVDPLKPVKSFECGYFGLYNMAGNAEEMVAEKGWVKGGSWNDTGFYLQNWYTEVYDSTNATSAERGFRIIMKVIEK